MCGADGGGPEPVLAAGPSGLVYAFACVCVCVRGVFVSLCLCSLFAGVFVFALVKVACVRGLCLCLCSRFFLRVFVFALRGATRPSLFRTFSTLPSVYHVFS